MTLDEAIKRYTDNAEYERTHGNLQGCLEFRQLAEWLKDYKRLLEQESSDAISREDLLIFLYDYKDKHNNARDEYPINYGTLLDLIRYIRELPPVYPRQKVGYWIDKEVRGSIEPYCSECGDSIDVIYHYAYCPNCGVRMVESQKSEDKG